MSVRVLISVRVGDSDVSEQEAIFTRVPCVGEEVVTRESRERGLRMTVTAVKHLPNGERIEAEIVCDAVDRG